jgi:hypothetical protein
MWGEFWTTDAPAAKFPTSFAPPGESFAPPPERNSDNIAPLPLTNAKGANNLRGRGGAKLAEFRSTRKKKNISVVQNPRAALHKNSEWERSPIAMTAQKTTICWEIAMNRRQSRLPQLGFCAKQGVHHAAARN